jgi:hypothetical protein
MLSIALPGCARLPVETAPPPPVAITIRDRPPSDLLVCPAAPLGIPAGMAADIPPKVRAALIRLALAYRSSVDQLNRLIAWHDPQACAPPAKAP